MRIEEITKEYVGKTLYFRGNQNIKNRLLIAKVIKVNPKTVILEPEDGGECKITRKGSCVPAWNAGYDIFDSMEALKDDTKARHIKHDVADHIIRKADAKTIISIGRMLGLIS